MEQTQQGRNAHQFQLRISEELRKRVQDAADKSGRSLNSEIVFALQQKFLPARLGAKAAVELIGYIDAAQDDQQFFDRIAETRHYLQELHPSASIDAARDGTITIKMQT